MAPRIRARRTTKKPLSKRCSGVRWARGAYAHRATGSVSRRFRWLDTFLEEKGIDSEMVLKVEGPSGTNWMPVGVLVDAIKSAPAHEQAGIKAMLVKIDFRNAPVKPYLEHLAKAIAR